MEQSDEASDTSGGESSNGAEGGAPKVWQHNEEWVICHLCFLYRYFELDCCTTVRKACKELNDTFQIAVSPITAQPQLEKH